MQKWKLILIRLNTRPRGVHDVYFCLHVCILRHTLLLETANETFLLCFLHPLSSGFWGRKYDVEDILGLTKLDA